MSLKKVYTQTKNRKIANALASILGTLLGIGFVSLILFGINLLWNYVAVPWGLPNLSFLQFVATIALVRLIHIIYFGFPEKSKSKNLTKEEINAMFGIK